MGEGWDRLEVANGQVVLVLSPHPDDEALGCGGTVRAHVAAGGRVKLVFVTSGERGAPGPTGEDTVMIREAESAAAAQILGVTDLEFWRAPDGALTRCRGLTSRILGVLAGFGPEIVYAPHRAELHPDHRAVGRAAVRAAEATGPHRPVVRLFEVWTPMAEFAWVHDISEHIHTKRQAIAAYRSQLALGRMDDALVGLARYRGQMFSGWPASAEYAEVFAAG